MDFKVQSNCSTMPSHSRWQAVMFNFLIPNIVHRSIIKYD